MAIELIERLQSWIIHARIQGLARGSIDIVDVEEVIAALSAPPPPQEAEPASGQPSAGRIETLTQALAECAEKLEFLAIHLRGRMAEGALADITQTAADAREALSHE